MTHLAHSKCTVKLAEVAFAKGVGTTGVGISLDTGGGSHEGGA